MKQFIVECWYKFLNYCTKNYFLKTFAISLGLIIFPFVLLFVILAHSLDGIRKIMYDIGKLFVNDIPKYWRKKYESR